jgi:ABC-type nitrate/sulfonate/bicarbonate transport system substrate-binding protein
MNNERKSSLCLCAFKGLQNLPLYVARDQGFFADQGLEVEIIYTNGSVPQVAGLVHGEYDLIQTAPDNVVNANNNPAAFGLDPSTMPRIFMLFGGSNGPLSLYTQPSISTFHDLRGAVLGVDNPTSGFALVLRDLMGRNGLQLDRDYSFTIAGGTAARLDALSNSSIAATILYTPFDSQAAERGCHNLSSSTDYYLAYASNATAATQPWIEAHGDTLVRYIVALRHSLSWIYDPAHSTMVQSVLQHEPALALDAALAIRAYNAFVDPKTGYGIDGKLDEACLRQVIALRTAYSTPAQTYGEPSDYFDLSWYQKADESVK